MGKITPYGVYGIAANRGFVPVGVGHDPAVFAVHAAVAVVAARGEPALPAGAAAAGRLRRRRV
jgi:Rhodopirellula transposase DDE domain